MRTILYIIRKEFLQLKRNRSMLPLIFVMPIIQMLVLVNAASQEMKNIKICIVDNDLSSSSRKLTGKFHGSPFFIVKNSTFSIEEAENGIKNGETDVIVNIPAGFEKKLIRENKSSVQVLVNAINGTVAGISNAYINLIITGYNKELIVDWNGENKGLALQKAINIIPSFWYNPELNYKVFMVPAILVILITIMGMILSGLNIVSEKEIGTIEQINVTPIKKYQFIIGKLVPFWIIAMFELAFGLTLGKLLFNIPMVGNLWLLFFVAAIYLILVQGIGLLMSTVSSTQQQAMFIAFFFMLVFIMMSGIFTPTESMPIWAQRINYLNPVYYFMRVVRMILLKGSQFKDIIFEISCLATYAFLVLSFATWRYKKAN